MFRAGDITKIAMNLEYWRWKSSFRFFLLMAVWVAKEGALGVPSDRIVYAWVIISQRVSLQWFALEQCQFIICTMIVRFEI